MMKGKMMLVAAGLLIVAGLGLAGGQATTPTEKTWDQAIERFKRYYQEENPSNKDRWKLNAKPLGKKGLLVEMILKGRSPERKKRYLIMSPEGGIEPFSTRALWEIYYSQEGKYPEDNDKEKMIKDFIAQVEEYPQWKTIQSVHDIPDYEKAPLDEDVAQVIRAPWKSSTGISHKRYMITTYTYSAVGGHVKRYQFTFSSNHHFFEATCLELGRGIGSYLLLD